METPEEVKKILGLKVKGITVAMLFFVAGLGWVANHFHDDYIENQQRTLKHDLEIINLKIRHRKETDSLIMLFNGYHSEMHQLHDHD